MSYGFYSSIVAALRSESQAEDHRGAGGLCRDAADEIERLRKALEAIQQRANESGTGEMGLMDTIHAVHKIVVDSLAVVGGSRDA